MVLQRQRKESKKCILLHTRRRLNNDCSTGIPPKLGPLPKRLTGNSSRLPWSWPRDILCIPLSDSLDMQSMARRLIVRNGTMNVTRSSCSQHNERYCTWILSFMRQAILHTVHRHRQLERWGFSKGVTSRFRAADPGIVLAISRDRQSVAEATPGVILSSTS
jgi:hypothetical protein